MGERISATRAPRHSIHGEGDRHEGFFHSGVKEVVIPASALFAIDRSTFDRIDKECTLYVPRGAKIAYASTLGWDNFTRIVEM